jgi:branched-subunit amino acid transport protein AzlD
MKTSLLAALGLTFAMGAVIFFCRLFPFLFFRGKRGSRSEAGGGEKADTNRQDEEGEKEKAVGADGMGRKNSHREIFFNFVGKLVPPAAMTVLAVNAMAGSFTTDLREGIPVLAAAALTALVHLWKRNPLLSIFGGTAACMILERILMRG